MVMPPGLGIKVVILDVSRPSQDLPQVAQDVIEMGKKSGIPLASWAQPGGENVEAKIMLSANKIPYVMNACLRVVHKLL